MPALWEESPQSVGTLGNKLYLDSGTLTPLLKRMEAAGLVTRKRDAEDQRRVFVALTPVGRALRKAALFVPATLQSGLDLSSIDVEEVRDTVQKLVRMLARAKKFEPA